jgi:hypothetical protein
MYPDDSCPGTRHRILVAVMKMMLQEGPCALSALSEWDVRASQAALAILQKTRNRLVLVRIYNLSQRGSKRTDGSKELHRRPLCNYGEASMPAASHNYNTNDNSLTGQY